MTLIFWVMATKILLKGAWHASAKFLTTQNAQFKKVSLTSGGDSKAHVGPQCRVWPLFSHLPVAEATSGERRGGGREGRSRVLGVDHITPTRDGNFP